MNEKKFPYHFRFFLLLKIVKYFKAFIASTTNLKTIPSTSTSYATNTTEKPKVTIAIDIEANNLTSITKNNTNHTFENIIIRSPITLDSLNLSVTSALKIG